MPMSSSATAERSPPTSTSSPGSTALTTRSSAGWSAATDAGAAGLSARPDRGSETKAHAVVVEDKIADGIDSDVAGPFEETFAAPLAPVSYTHLRAHETDSYLVCRLLL